MFPLYLKFILRNLLFLKRNCTVFTCSKLITCKTGQELVFAEYLRFYLIFYSVQKTSEGILSKPQKINLQSKSYTLLNHVFQYNSHNFVVSGIIFQEKCFSSGNSTLSSCAKLSQDMRSIVTNETNQCGPHSYNYNENIDINNLPLYITRILCAHCYVT